jgi:hypothetical protein
MAAKYQLEPSEMLEILDTAEGDGSTDGDDSFDSEEEKEFQQFVADSFPAEPLTVNAPTSSASALTHPRISPVISK